jgi:hypothetical protein
MIIIWITKVHNGVNARKPLCYMKEKDTSKQVLGDFHGGFAEGIHNPLIYDYLLPCLPDKFWDYSGVFYIDSKH